ncbi:preprotein translocase subunit TatA [Salinigranum halophilum]|jgi:sec-independent protein translocase protein TatA|uniref:preprotein translocase subunit TatA n=1 Tax=Salinigranum halophilum TaxID=2565931 RepID=UPI00115E7A21|nr:preprotein translocase subunit TatA [Salinigranum halophilum]
MVPLFPGVPGGPELLVVLLLAVALFGVPVVVAVLGWRHLRGSGRVDELEARVRELESELEDVDDERTEHGRPDDGGGRGTDDEPPR